MSRDSSGDVEGWTPRDPSRREVGAVAAILVVGCAAWLLATGSSGAVTVLVTAVAVAVAVVAYVAFFALEAWFLNRGTRGQRPPR